MLRRVQQGDTGGTARISFDSAYAIAADAIKTIDRVAKQRLTLFCTDSNVRIFAAQTDTTWLRSRSLEEVDGPTMIAVYADGAFYIW
jgi:hypothetical protein